MMIISVSDDESPTLSPRLRGWPGPLPPPLAIMMAGVFGDFIAIAVGAAAAAAGDAAAASGPWPPGPGPLGLWAASGRGAFFSL